MEPNETALATSAEAPADLTVQDLRQRTDEHGTKFEPVSAGLHVARFVDCVDVGPSDFQGKITHRLIFVLQVAELDPENNKPKLLLYWCNTSLFGGGPGLNISNHLKMLRGVTGMPGLTAEHLERTGYSTGKLIADGGRLARVFVTEKIGGGGKVKTEISSWSKAEQGDDAPPLSGYVRPDWVRKMAADARSDGSRQAEREQVAAALSAPLPQPAPTPPAGAPVPSAPAAAPTPVPVQQPATPEAQPAAEIDPPF